MREYTTRIEVTNSATGPRAAAMEALDDLAEHLRAGRIHIVTVTDNTTDAEHAIDLNDSTSGQEEPDDGR